jgi:MoaA/NifB/PqqE/SkfB family radical SAM enzyme
MREPLSQGTRFIGGTRIWLLRLGVRLNILFLALKAYQNPRTAVGVLKSLIAKRAAILGDRGIDKAFRAGGRQFWAIASPGWPSAAFNAFVRSELHKAKPFPGGKPRLQTAIFSISSRCPLRCEHCYEWDRLSAEETLDFSQLRLILRKLQAYGVSNVEFSGGEPLARYEDLLRLLKVARPGTDFWILTSGFGLTLERARELKSAGLTGASISLDDWDEERHNRFRGNGDSFRWALEAARNASAAGLATAFSLCARRVFITHDNLLRYLKLAAENGAGLVRILEPRNAGRFREREIELEPEQIECLDEFYLFTKRDPSCRNLPGVEYTGYHQRRHGCFGAGVRYLYIDSKGDAHACPFCQNPVGSVLSDPLGECLGRLQAIGCHKFGTRRSEAGLGK